MGVHSVAMASEPLPESGRWLIMRTMLPAADRRIKQGYGSSGEQISPRALIFHSVRTILAARFHTRTDLANISNRTNMFYGRKAGEGGFEERRSTNRFDNGEYLWRLKWI